MSTIKQDSVTESGSASVNAASWRVVGTRPIRHDGVEKVTGKANYGADFSANNDALSDQEVAAVAHRGSPRVLRKQPKYVMSTPVIGRPLGRTNWCVRNALLAADEVRVFCRMHSSVASCWCAFAMCLSVVRV